MSVDARLRAYAIVARTPRLDPALSKTKVEQALDSGVQGPAQLGGLVADIIRGDALRIENQVLGNEHVHSGLPYILVINVGQAQIKSGLEQFPKQLYHGPVDEADEEILEIDRTYVRLREYAVELEQRLGIAGEGAGEEAEHAPGS